MTLKIAYIAEDGLYPVAYRAGWLLGAEVEHFPTAVGALDALASTSYNAVISDLDMAPGSRASHGSDAPYFSDDLFKNMAGGRFSDPDYRGIALFMLGEMRKQQNPNSTTPLIVIGEFDSLGMFSPETISQVMALRPHAYTSRYSPSDELANLVRGAIPKP